MVEKRVWMRVTWKTNLRAQDIKSKEDLVPEGRLRNVSKSGFAFFSEESLNRGVIYQFNISVEGYPLPVMGKVMHIRNEGTYFLIGVRIESISFFEKARFNRFLSRKTNQLNKLFMAYSIAGGILLWLAFQLLFGTSLLAGFITFLVGTTLLYLIKPF